MIRIIIIDSCVLIMSQLKKRERSSNFAKSETRLFIELVTKYRSIIENKKTDAVTNRKKDATWTTIATTFNAASSGPTRTTKTLKLKYESLKYYLKKKMMLYRTGGPSAAPALDDVETKVLAICSDISGLEARNDSDNFTDIANGEMPVMAINGGIPEVFNIGNEVSPRPADIYEQEFQETLLQNNKDPPVEVVMGEPDDFYRDGNKAIDNDTHHHGVSKDPENWHRWSPKLLRIKKLQSPKDTSKVSLKKKLDQLRAARLELVQLHKEIALSGHSFIKEEHDLKMQHLQNEESRKQELHELMLVAMRKRNST